MTQASSFRKQESSQVDAAVEPGLAAWRDPATYDSVLVQKFAVPIQEAVRHGGGVPLALQVQMLRHLHWYFTVDLRERAPTVTLTESMAPAFHDRVRQIMQYVEVDALHALDSREVGTEVRHALLSYKAPALYSAVALDACDHDQGMVRLSYYVHGNPPAEAFLVDGTPTQPAYAKYRACRFFHRMLLRQRIVWLPVVGATTLEVRLADQFAPVGVGPQAFAVGLASGQSGPRLSATALLASARVAYPPGKGGQQPLPPGWQGWKVRLLRSLAGTPLARKRFARSWVFLDREEDADDNAEHLYRWVRAHHPEINAWFLLSRSSPDWNRLAREGFRLVPPGLMRKLLILNSEHIISSHAEYVFGGMERHLFGDAMRWRYTFLQHGVTVNDVSHWLGPGEFDCFITSSPAEHTSVVGDDTAYPYTEREVRCAGLPRHDRLLQIARRMPAAQVNVLLVMPTWRSGLVDESRPEHECIDQFAASDYARHWRALLRNEELHQLVAQHGQRLTFMPHPNAVPYIDTFDLPRHVEFASKATSSVQQVFARSTGFITDYTSVAFDMAVLRRPVCYYQFDRAHFYSGGHNWRIGYFDYERDGFGPVALTEAELLKHLRRYFANDGRVEPEYLARMTKAMPLHDHQACARVFKSILDIRRSVPGVPSLDR